ncbi:MAG: FAD-dependent oxidoreductase [Parvularculaceae bacterium]|nr:FAD-dependent oxidoreductase [Parvularculaceae bacterium]
MTHETPESDAEFVIVGAGPAGMRAAIDAAGHGLKVIVIDEQDQPGGQIYRRPPQAFSVKNWLPEKIYESGRLLHRQVTDHEKIQFVHSSSVIGLFKEVADHRRFRLVVNGKGRCFDIRANHVLVATGCHELPVLFPGWTTPGVMLAGGVQVMLKSQQIVPGETFLFVGAHPLQLIVAEQIQRAGGRVAGVVFAQPLQRLLTVLKSPATMLGQAPRMTYFFNVLRKLRKSRTPIIFGTTIVGVEGAQAVSGAVLAEIDGSGAVDATRTTRLRCDRLALCFNFVASSELPRQAGADCHWSASRGGWLIRHDEWMRSSVSGLYVAGEITGVAGAEASQEEGAIAALGVLLDAGRLTQDEAMRLARPVRRRLADFEKFAGLLARLAHLDETLTDQLATPDTLMCKCQEVTVAQVDAALTNNLDISSASALKLYSRVGMGLCQGRFCHYHVLRKIAKTRNLAPERVGAFTPQFPVKPTPVGDLI